MWWIVSSSRHMLVGIESWFMISMSSINWCTISSFFSSPWPEFMDIHWLDALDWASLHRLTTIFLNRLHSNSRVAICYFCCTYVPIIDENWEMDWCSLSWTFEFTKNMKFYYIESFLHGIEELSLFLTAPWNPLVLNQCQSTKLNP